MASLYISEYGENSFRQLGGLPVASEPSVVDQTPVAIGTEAKSAPFGALTRVIRVHCDVACSILIGKDPVATTASKRLPIDHTEYFSVQPGHRLSVIVNA